jgi:hypothetical protein
MSDKTHLTEAQMSTAVSWLSQPGETYATVAMRMGVPYWVISGSFRKVNVVMSVSERDTLRDAAEAVGLSEGEFMADLFNKYFPAYLKKKDLYVVK